MKKGKIYKTATKKVKTTKEPSLIYQSRNLKTIQFFSSFEEQAEAEAIERFNLSYDDRLIQAEILRRMVYSDYILPNGKWMPIKKKITLNKID